MKKCKYQRKPYKPVDHSRLRETRILSGLSKKEAAQMMFVTHRTWHNWESGRIKVPYAVFKLLHILTGYELPGDVWRGWCFSGGALWSPEGKKFTPTDLNYLWLTFEMARQWRFDRQKKQDSKIKLDKSNLLPFVPSNNGKKNVVSKVS